MEKLSLNITVVGLGLIGGSLAMALKELKPNKLFGIDIDKNVLKIAKEAEIIDEGYLNAEIPLKMSDIVIICLYPEHTVNFIKKNIDNFKTNAIITDTAGIKEKLINSVHSFLPEHLDFIGGHPMAGKENNGIKNASKDLFKDANYIITPTQRNNEKNIEKVETIAKLIGCGNVIRVSPRDHDKIISYTSHLPHVLATTLVNSNQKEDIDLFIGGSFYDASRVATVNSELWTELMIENTENVIETIELFEENLKNIKDTIQNRDKKKLKNILFNGCKEREKIFVKK